MLTRKTENYYEVKLKAYVLSAGSKTTLSERERERERIHD